MKLSSRSIKNYFEKEMVIPCEESNIQETILKARKAYYEAEGNKFLSKIEFIYYQGRYIKKRWWLMQGVLLVLLWLFLKYMDSSYYIQRGMGIAAPIFVLLVVPEIWKNRSTNAMEVEGAAFYSIREIYAARMILFAMVDFVLLSLFFLAAAYTAKITLWELIIQFFVPFHVACCICFRLVYSRRGNSQILAVFLCLFWMAVWVQIVLNETVYTAVSVPMWIALLLLSGMYLGYSIWQGQKQCRLMELPMFNRI